MGTLIFLGLGAIFAVYVAYAVCADGLPRLVGFIVRKMAERKTISDRQPAP